MKIPRDISISGFLSICVVTLTSMLQSDSLIYTIKPPLQNLSFYNDSRSPLSFFPSQIVLGTQTPFITYAYVWLQPTHEHSVRAGEAENSPASVTVYFSIKQRVSLLPNSVTLCHLSHKTMLALRDAQNVT